MSTPQYTPQDIKRFWAKIALTDNPNDCWLWTASTLPRGYGKIRFGGRNGTEKLAHRVAWELSHGVIPDGLNVLHNCPNGDNPRCCNPNHLFLGTQQENITDMVRKGRAATGQRNGAYTHPEKRRSGEAHPLHKLNESDVREIRKRHEMGNVTFQKLAIEFHVNPATIRDIVTRRRWRDLA